MKTSHGNTTHGMFYTRFYKTWASMKARCNNSNEKCFKYYGGKGIKCLWDTFEEFKSDMYSSYQEHCKTFGEKNTFIERIDNSKNYCRENCKWATKVEQANNKSNIHKMFIPEGFYTVSDLARKFGMKPSSFYVAVSRIKKKG